MVLKTRRSAKLATLGLSVAALATLAAGCGSANSSQATSGGSPSSSPASSPSSPRATSPSTSSSTPPISAASGSVLFDAYTTSQSFTATVSALQHAVSHNGMMVLGTLNQAGALKTTGLQLKGAESFFVGNPVAGKKLFQMNPAVGAELPLRVFVWVNTLGKTEVGYFQPSTLMGAVNAGLAKPGVMMNQKLAMIVKQVSSGAAASAPTVHQIPFKHQTSSHAFSATVTALKHAVSSNGMMVLGTLNQAGALKTTGLQLKGAESFFVGNPVAGKKLFQMNPAVGAELPLRVFVWVDAQGKTEVGYFQPSALMGAVNASLAKPGMMMNQKLAMIVQQATH